MESYQDVEKWLKHFFCLKYFISNGLRKRKRRIKKLSREKDLKEEANDLDSLHRRVEIFYNIRSLRGHKKVQRFIKELSHKDNKSSGKLL